MNKGMVIASNEYLVAWFLEAPLRTNSYYVVTEEGIPLFVTTDPQELNNWWRAATNDWTRPAPAK